ncbi:phosphoesterase [Desulfosoma sp.]|uniref:phosphoesterase n=1 Tax=Desulfosoma sp. TaxID=2603217 RepID=UPI00404B9CC3
MSAEEQVLCVARQGLPAAWLGRRTALPLTYAQCLEVLSAAGCGYRPRRDAEQDPRFKQLIPYVVALDSRGLKVGCYRRKGSETRLHGLESVGIGGHITLEDAADASDDLASALARGLHRELSEEFAVLPQPIEPIFQGIINEEETQVGHVHLGLVFLLKVAHPEAVRPAAELHHFRWLALSPALRRPLELWSRLALRLVQ